MLKFGYYTGNINYYTGLNTINNLDMLHGTFSLVINGYHTFHKVITDSPQMGCREQDLPFVQLLSPTISISVTFIVNNQQQYLHRQRQAKEQQYPACSADKIL